MVKVHITTKSGAQITVEGSKHEVAELVGSIEAGSGRTAGERRRTAPMRKKHQKSSSRPTLNNLLSELIDGGFFKKPKELGAIKLALEEQGHFYPVTTLSPVLLRMVRRKHLRRLKDKNRWLYVG